MALKDVNQIPSGAFPQPALSVVRLRAVPVATSPAQPSIPTPATYKMRGRDVDCGSLIYRYWTATGAPDYTGAQYAGAKCGASPLADIIRITLETLKNEREPRWPTCSTPA